ncbi:coiled-coil domain-containing protein 42-like [Megalops cyprinoides]|uniref:coiled-coil domain-containing protein 42-like n=1 Tax=Megalops cyprinoides TaxID=118141 RepID=UPI001863C96F|nr:coiled-coil domain-containing protein 42-like [Megalops cyprinoides]
MQKKLAEEEANTELRMKEKFESTLREVEEHKEMLRKKVAEMEERKEEFKDYLKIKDAQEHRVVKKARHDRQLTNQKQEHLCDLREEIKDLIKERDRLAKRVQNYTAYHLCMEKVVHATKMEARQLMSRFDTLIVARDNLRVTTQQNQDRIRTARAHLTRFTEESSDALMKLNSTAAQLQRQLDEANQNRVHWENTWARIQKTAAEKTMLFGQIRMATLNLYRNVTKNSKFSKESPVHLEDTIGQLERVLLQEDSN